MSDRGTKDEAFIGDAYTGVVDRRNIADQSLYNGYMKDEIPSGQLAVFITAVKIYNKQNILSDQDVEKAEEAKTFGDVRNLVDEFHPKWLASRN
ncbi:hypothetical protein [Psychrobacter fozii]|uniref:Uncharacterized protein n=1 Tax=Psychrobacter fozii TaxID=198480 RepID=A0A2V4UJ55_9GAMM|nr:hypothetical protein [Psychrobacter fozii]PYE36646.1 hypothetical protein DFP82_11293 [Psychrobacter fozii]